MGRKAGRRKATSESDDEDKVLADAQKEVAKNKQRAPRKKVARIMTLDELVEEHEADVKKKAYYKSKREERLAAKTNRDEKGSQSTALGSMIDAMDRNLETLDADSHFFERKDESISEAFGFVFTPMTEPLSYIPFKATASELNGPLGMLYKALQTTDEEELKQLLWSKALLQFLMLQKCPNGCVNDSQDSILAAKRVVRLPTRIARWLFTTMSKHSSTDVVAGCFYILFISLQSSMQTVNKAPFEVAMGLPTAQTSLPIGDLSSLFDDSALFGMEWEPAFIDFLSIFRQYGFNDSKRSMAMKSKIMSEAPAPPSGEDVAFPKTNMIFVLSYLIACLRTKSLHLSGYDAHQYTIFFLRMQFENHLGKQIVNLASRCIEELLEAFPRREWRKDYAPSLVLKIAGAKEGMFSTTTGWLAVARRLPCTPRGAELVTALAVYVLQHRIDQAADDRKQVNAMRFPPSSKLVLDIIVRMVDDLEETYGRNSSTVKKTHIPFGEIGHKVAFMDHALELYLNQVKPQMVKPLLDKLDTFVKAHRSMMALKWHELKTVVTLMRRKYAAGNLRVDKIDASTNINTVVID